PDLEGFVARHDELLFLAQALEADGSQVVIHGMPGVGKSTLARHYASTSASSYGSGVWWFDATEGFGPMAIQAIPELEKALPGFEPGDGLTPEARLRRCLQAWVAGSAEWALLVVDNLPAGSKGLQLLRYLCSGLPGVFRLLITQRSEPTTAVKAVDLQVMGREDSLALLSLHAGESGRVRIEAEAEQAAALVEDVDGLPLALILLAGRLRMVPSLSVSALRRDLARPNLEAAAFRAEHAELLAEQGVVATLLASWQSLSEEAHELARLLSFTLPGPIPWQLIQVCTPPEAPEPADVFWHQALAALVSANLLDRLDSMGQAYGVHALVRQFCGIQRQNWPEESFYRERLAVISQVLASAHEDDDVAAAVNYWRQASTVDPTAATAGFGLGYSLIRLGDLDGARQAFEQSKAAAEIAQDQRGVSIALNGLGDVLVSQGDGPGALAAYQAGLRIAEGLAKRDPANTQWQVDLAVSCAKLGSLNSLLPIHTRKEHLLRGRAILQALKSSGRLHPNQDSISWFDRALAGLGEGKYNRFHDVAPLWRIH
ncbi:MAG: NB-ARC domain-containing protein, partial [Cyanobium sp.]